ncbi:MAG: hypothetical protein JST68_30950 [Bacteroidetes bacterium]|nr:hypothetical protein [Bacteroidota bacterium]
MNQKQIGIRFFAFRLLLLCGYLFLFASQSNGRYFTTANFFVYGPHHQVHISKTVHSVALQIRTQAPVHLSVDKRFDWQAEISPVFSHSPIPVAYQETISSFFLPSFVPSSPDLSANALRGPPRA